MNGREGPGPEVVRVRISRTDLRDFATSIGETRLFHLSVRSARAAGHRDLPVLPTYLFGLALRTGSPFGWATDNGPDMARTLHGEQSFEYAAMTFAGDTLTLSSTCGPLTLARSGARLLTRRTTVSRGEEIVARLELTLVCPAAPA
jgi:acyl dehydratase